MAAQIPPPPNAQVLSLVSALSQTENHDLHVQAIRAKDEALSSSPSSYGNLCAQLALLLVGCNHPEQMLHQIDRSSLDGWRQANQSVALRLESDPMQWIPFGQMGGLILKNALLRPPIQPTGRPLSLSSEDATRLKETMIFGLSLDRPELYNVVSSIIATTSVSVDGVQPFMHISQWPELMPILLQNIHNALNSSNLSSLNGSLTTVRKMMEDGPSEIPVMALDSIVPLLLRLFQATDENIKVAALQSIVACLASGMVPSSLVIHFSDYFTGLSHLASDESAKVKKWVCRSINTILELHTHYLQPHMGSLCQFMLQATVLQPSQADDIVAVEASEFWLLFATLDETRLTSDMMDIVEKLLPNLIPILLNNIVYSEEQRIEILAQNEVDLEMKESMKPIFHNSKQKHDGQSNMDSEDDSDDDGWDEDDNEWNLRKYSGASLDSLSNLYGAGPILPALLPALQQGLSSGDAWTQEASILALGAIAEGCHEEMNAHVGELYPFLINLLSAPETPQSLPQLKSICAWTIGRYAAWAVDQVQTGAQGHLLAQVTEVLLKRLEDRNRKVQIACGSALGVVIETSGDLLLPYLEHICPPLVSAMSRYQGRSLVIIFDTLGIMADSCGPAIGEHELPAMYVPTMLHVLNTILLNNPSDQTLLPLMESLASVALACGMNFQPYALETLEDAMCVIEQVQLALATADKVTEEEADPIVCATDLIDGLCEGLGNNFIPLVASSNRYGQHFVSVLHSLCKYQAVGVRISALALLGDIARNAPSLIEPGLSELLREAISNIEPTQHEMHSSLANNAVWAIGEICVQCGSNSSPFEPFAPVLMQQLIVLLMGNGDGRVSSVPGLAENAAACVGRLAVLNTSFVAPELPRFLLGWCDGISKVLDPTERRDAFTGFCKALYANPQAIQQCGVNVADVISSILFAIISWHIPPETNTEQVDFLTGDYGFQPFPPSEAEIGLQLAKLMKDIKASVGPDVWGSTQAQLPVNVRRLLQKAYDL
mmetsp:Transcript_38685/g.93533  ORF Transcript_38685/g.93533 Transcript_38685/m.93533 type:complete len:1003 (+) Transcript_38685:66-3074(+)